MLQVIKTRLCCFIFYLFVLGLISSSLAEPLFSFTITTGLGTQKELRIVEISDRKTNIYRELTKVTGLTFYKQWGIFQYIPVNQIKEIRGLDRHTVECELVTGEIIQNCSVGHNAWGHGLIDDNGNEVQLASFDKASFASSKDASNSQKNNPLTLNWRIVSEVVSENLSNGTKQITKHSYDVANPRMICYTKKNTSAVQFTTFLVEDQPIEFSEFIEGIFTRDENNINNVNGSFESQTGGALSGQISLKNDLELRNTSLIADLGEGRLIVFDFRSSAIVLKKIGGTPVATLEAIPVIAPSVAVPSIQNVSSKLPAQ